MYVLVRVNYLLLAIKAIVDADVNGTSSVSQDVEINMIRSHIYEALGLEIPNSSAERQKGGTQ